MYSYTQINDRQMFACSVPPSYSPNLHEDFAELSRIHFYLGRAPIDAMIEAVEQASLEHIAQGQIQIYFAVKEIEDFLKSGGYNCNYEENVHFKEAFENILKHTIEVLDKAYVSPTKKDNTIAIETMIGLTQEVKFLSQQLKESGIDVSYNTENFSIIEEKYKKILKLKDNYENLTQLKEFSSYEEVAKESVIKQLKQKYEFNCGELNKIYFNTDSWMWTLDTLSEEREKMLSDPNYVYDYEEAQELKDNFLKQIKSFNQILQNGVVNYIHSTAAKISKSIFYHAQNSMVGTQTAYDREVNYHKKQIESIYGSSKYHKEELAKLEATKDEYIQRKKESKNFYEEALINLHNQERYIYQSLAKVRHNLFNTVLKDTVTFEGDINTGFVIGHFSNSEKVLLIHRDHFVDAENAVYAMILPKREYDNLVINNKLSYTKELRESKFSGASNFYNYGQFLQEVNSPSIQKFFLGQEFDLVDKTTCYQEERKANNKARMY